ncbi:MAG: RNA polymerase sigma factor [Oscillospiraceae bacterium]|nr:RNA polymerase sigma factor [Oscillospiraceae bacterium]
MNDEQIIDLLEQRNERALAEIRNKYGKSCQTIAYRLLGSMPDADEIVNDTLLHTWNAIPPARPKNLFSFLAAITRRSAINRYQLEHALKRGGQAEQDAVLEELDTCIPSDENVVNHVEQRELRDAVERFLRTLKPDVRAIMIQRYVNLHSVREIAEAYQISESKVKITLMRTRKKLRSFLEKEDWL